jgi:hypothetical protein
MNQRARDRHLQDKLAAFEAYGGAVCACCGEIEIAFLTLDHVNGDGDGRSDPHFYRTLRLDDYPDEPALQVLCFNCNSGRVLNDGICPHKKEVFA